MNSNACFLEDHIQSVASAPAHTVLRLCGTAARDFLDQFETQATRPLAEWGDGDGSTFLQAVVFPVLEDFLPIFSRLFPALRLAFWLSGWMVAWPGLQKRIEMMTRQRWLADSPLAPHRLNALKLALRCHVGYDRFLQVGREAISHE